MMVDLRQERLGRVAPHAWGERIAGSVASGPPSVASLEMEPRSGSMEAPGADHSPGLKTQRFFLCFHSK